MNMFSRCIVWLKKPIVAGAVIVLVAAALILIIKNASNSTDEQTEQSLPAVTLVSSESLSATLDLNLIGTVRAFTEAQITTETAGRVTSVNTSLGAEVPSGAVMVTLENASEQAAVLQAQGVYEAALAAAEQSTVSEEEARTNVTAAKNSLVAAIRTGYNSTNAAVRNNIDPFFADPDSSVPGLRLDGKGMAQSLNAERVSFQIILPEWQSEVNTINANSDLATNAGTAKANINRTIAFLDTFITLFALQDDNSRYTDAQLIAFSDTFTAQRSALLQQLSAIENAEASLAGAEDALRRAQIGAAGNSNSAADAQVKQALGSLRAAQANLAKTILRTPISGTVNALDVKVGDFVGSFETIAIVANNSALEVVTFVGDLERDSLSVGDTVLVEDIEGTITNIAPSVNAQTRKTEVRIAIESTEIANGDTVRIRKEVSTDRDVNEALFIPITAVKFEATDGYVFQVDGDSALVQVPVTIGTIRGSEVEITSGLSASDLFVKDARGLTSGTKVSTSTN